MGTVTTQPEAGSQSELMVKNPRTGEFIYTVPEASPEHIRKVYEASWKIYETTRAMTVRERIDETLKLKRHILKHKEIIIDRIISETGKSRMDALLSEIFTVLDAIDYYAKHAEKMLRDEKVSTPVLLFGKKSRIYYEAIGPVLMITPWNYPFNLMLVPFVCAFLAGNPVIFKPSEHTPLKDLLEEIFEQSGFMKHAMQVVYGGKDTGRQLIDEKPAKILFTGSVRGGRQVMAQAAQYIIPVELELGGKDPMVVFEDVNIERTVNGAIWGSMTNSGQTCTAVERVYVHESIRDEFVKVLCEKVEALGTFADCSDGHDQGNVDMGCMTTGFQVELVKDQVDDAISKGAKALTGGSRVGESHSFEPTVLVDIDDSMKIAREETFGPVLTVQTFATEEEAISMANDSPYGLNSSVWSADLVRAERVARRIEAGNVSINNVLATQANTGLPFGGVKQSGFGRYKGSQGLHSFSNVKSVMIDKQSATIELNWYPYTKEKYGLFTQLLDMAFSEKPLATLRSLLVGLKLQALGKKQKL